MSLAKPPKTTHDVLVFQLPLIFHLLNYLIISLSFFIISCWALFLTTGRSDVFLWTWAILTVMYSMLPTDYAYVCVNRVSIDTITQCCTSAKLCCGFMEFSTTVASAMLYKSTDSQSEILQFIQVASIGRTQ